MATPAGAGKQCSKDLGDQVKDQAQRRLFQGEPVLNEEKILSIFAPPTDLIK